MPLIGAHISVAGGLSKAFPRADEINCEAMQIFTRNQRQWQNKPVSLDEAKDFYRAWEKSNVKIVVSHASYLINIASDNQASAYRSYKALLDEVERCRQLGIDDIVLHPGFAIDAPKEIAIQNIVDNLKKLFRETDGCNVRILLETMAGQGSVIGGSLSHFAQIGDMLDWNPRLAFCADTCHLFAAGYDLSSADAYEHFITAVDKHIGYDNILCWHLNDSKMACGSKLDRHTHLGDGQIGFAPFAVLMNDSRFTDIPAILETPKDGIGDIGNLSFLRKVRGA